MKQVIISILFIVCFQCAFATDYYVSTSGNDASGNGSQASPWRTLKAACTKVPANQGHTIRVSAGTFVELQMTVPTGVSILGAGRDVTIIKAHPSFYYNPASPGFGTDKFLINFSSAAPTNGNQSIKDLTIDGDGKKLHGGIYVRYRNVILIERVKVQYTNFTGIWLWDMKDSRMTDVQFKDCAWGSTGWSAATLLLANLERVEIDHIDVNENFGEGVKSLGANGDGNGKLHYVKFHDNHISVTPVGQWNGGAAPNIAVELWNIELLGFEMYNNYIDNTVSLVNDQPKFTNPKGVTTIHVYNNFFDMETRGGGYAMEASLHDIEVDHNYFLRGAHGIVNWSTHGINMSNWLIHHNVFYGIENNNPGAILRAKQDGFHNVKFYNNTVELAGTRTTNVLTIMDGASNNVEIKNNLIIDSNTAYSHYPNKLVYIEKGTLTGLQVTNNLLLKIPAGTVAGTYANNLTVDPKINKAGVRPTPYYLPLAGSPLIDAGVNVGLPFTGNAPDIGAYESTGSTISVTGVSISPSSLTLAAMATSQLSKTISPANATNQNVTWNSSNPNVATVSSTGLVTAIAAGSATITVTTLDGNKTAASVITVGSSQVATVDLDDANLGSGTNQFNYAGSGWLHGTNATDPFLLNTCSYSNVLSNTVTLPFTGHKVELYTAKASHHGIAAISVDNGPETFVDLYAPTRQSFVAVYNSILTEGNHTIKIRVPGTKNTASTGTYVVIDYLKVYSNSAAIPVTGVSVSPSTVPLNVASTYQLTATVSPATATNKNVTWSSNNTSIATVSSVGLITAVAPGSATITASTVDGGKTSSSVVTITVPVTGVSVTPATVPLGVGATYQLAATVSPSNATNKNVTWSSSNTSVATVNSAGLITAVSSGSATITASTVDGGKTSSSVVTITVPVTGVSVTPATVPLGAGATYQLVATVSPANATNKNVTWTTSNPGIATVSPSGLVTAVASGSVTITATTVDGGKTGSSVVTVIVPVTSVSVAPATLPLGVGATYQLTATVSPSNATNKNVTWNSSNPAIAAVSPSGLVTAAASGSVTITATTVDGGKTGSSVVTVIVPVTSVSVTPATLPLGVGATYQLVATVSPSNATNKNVTWSSSSPGIATVSPGGLVTAVASGSVTITATTVDGGKTGSSVVTVIVPVTSVSVTPATLPLGVGTTYQLTATVSPSNATNQNVTWNSSNPGIATVSPSGLVTAVASGSATITVTTVDGGRVNSSTINVTVPVTSVSIAPLGVPLTVGDTYQLAVTVNPANASNKNITWNSDNTSIATVSASGLVTSLAPGSAVITVTTVDGNKTATATVTINPQQNFVDLDDATIGPNINQFKYTGSTWTNAVNTSDSYFNRTCSHSNTSNNYATLSFVGNKVELYTSKASHHGIAAVSIDNGTEILVDLYSATRQDFVMAFSSVSLTEGNHTIKIRVTGTKAASSSGTYVVIDYLKVYSGSASSSATTSLMNAPAPASLATSEAELTGQIQVFPNPVKSGDLLHVTVPVASGTVSVIDATGFAHYTAQATTTELEIPTSGLPTGMYFVQYRTAQGEILLKILVN